MSPHGSARRRGPGATSTRSVCGAVRVARANANSTREVVAGLPAYRVLIVDPCRRNLERLAQTAREAGGLAPEEISTCVTQRDIAPAALANPWIACVRVDDPRLGGLELLRTIRRVAPWTQLIAMYANSFDPVRARVVAEGTSLCLQLDELTGVLPAVLTVVSAYRRELPNVLAQISMADELASMMGPDVAMAFGFSPPPRVGSSLRQAEANAVRDALHMADGNKACAARILEVGRTTLYRLIEKHGLEHG